MCDQVSLCHLGGPNTVDVQAKRLLISTRRILISVNHFPSFTTRYNYLFFTISVRKGANKYHYYKMPFSIRGPNISPSNLLNIRVLQAVLATIYVILIGYSSVHRGWWLNLRRPLVFGGMSSQISPSFFYTSLQCSITTTGKSTSSIPTAQLPTQTLHCIRPILSYSTNTLKPCRMRILLLQPADYTQAWQRSSHT